MKTKELETLSKEELISFILEKKEKVKGSIQKWREKNPGYHKKYYKNKEKRETTPDELNSKKLYQREWRKNNPAYYKKWSEKNPDYHKKRIKQLNKEKESREKEIIVKQKPIYFPDKNDYYKSKTPIIPKKIENKIQEYLKGLKKN